MLNCTFNKVRGIKIILFCIYFKLRPLVFLVELNLVNMHWMCQNYFCRSCVAAVDLCQPDSIWAKHCLHESLAWSCWLHMFHFAFIGSDCKGTSIIPELTQAKKCFILRVDDQRCWAHPHSQPDHLERRLVRLTVGEPEEKPLKHH